MSAAEFKLVAYLKVGFNPGVNKILKQIKIQYISNRLKCIYINKHVDYLVIKTVPCACALGATSAHVLLIKLISPALRAILFAFDFRVFFIRLKFV